jgi:hypothetical protein
MTLQISIFEILSCVLSCVFGFSANSLLHFHFVFEETVLFRTLLITVYHLISPYTLTSSLVSFFAIPILFLELHLQMNLSASCVAFRWHHTVEIQEK